MLRTENKDPVPAHVDCTQHGIDDRSNQSFTGATYLTVDVVRSLAREDCDRTDISWYATLYTERFPWIARFVLCNTVAVLAGMTNTGFIKHTGNRPAHVHQDEADSSPYSRVGSYPWPKAIHTAIDIQLLGCRAIHN